MAKSFLSVLFLDVAVLVCSGITAAVLGFFFLGQYTEKARVPGIITITGPGCSKRWSGKTGSRIVCAGEHDYSVASR